MRKLVLAGLLLVVAGCASPEDTPPPNIIIILTDDQGWGDVSYNGNYNLETPNIDRIGEQGATFHHFYVSPVCSPTRAELLTGRHHFRSGVTSTSAGQERMDLDETTLAEVLKEAGYATGVFGKWHNGSQPPYHPNARGFDLFYGFPSGHWGDYFSPPLERNGEMVRGEGYLPDDLTTQALAFMEEHQDQPFLAYLPYNTPHSPMQVPDTSWSALASRPLLQRHREPEREDLTHTRAALAMVSNIDWNVGRIVSGLEEMGLQENTLVLFFSDNGPNGARWNGGMKGRKGSTDEGGVRSPFVVQWPSTIAAGLEVDHIASVMDLFPTLLDLVGVAYPEDNPLDGISLAPLLTDGEYEAEDRIIFTHWRGRFSARNQKFRLDDQNQLFDLVEDPGQYTDVAEHFPEVASMLTEAKEGFQAEVEAALPEEDKRPFTLGHPDFVWTHLPARDAQTTGQIIRSNRYPNDSHFTSWTSTEDSIYWEVDVLAAGQFEVTLYYTVPDGSQGASIAVSMGTHRLEATISEAHDPPLRGMEHDRTPRIESYVKDFRPLILGELSLSEGQGPLVLQALTMPGSEVMDLKMLSFRRL